MISMLWKSFGDADAYADVLKKWRWKFLLYFFFLTLLCSAIIFIPAIYRVNVFLSENGDHIASQIPNGKILDGQFFMDAKSPHFVTLKDGSKFMAFSTGFLDASQVEGLFMSLEKNRVSFYNAGGETNISYDELESQFKPFKMEQSPVLDLKDGIAINGENFKKSIPFLRFISLISLPIAFYMVVTMMAFVFVFSLSFPAYILSLTRLPKLGYVGALKLSFIASTPAMLFQSLEMSIGYSVFGSFVYAILSFVIIWRVIRRLAQKENGTTIAD